MHLRVRCRVGEATRVAEALTALGWGTLWIDEPWVQTTNEDGYVLGRADENAEAVVHAWPTRDGDALDPPRRVAGLEVETVTDVDANAIDWSVAWRDGYPARVEIVAGIVLVPPWSAPREGERAIVVEPSPAFGSGLHPTTLACLRALHATLRADDAVLDLGAGSGVLSVAAVMWGAGDVVAVDLDPGSEGAIANNLQRNGLAPGRVRFVGADFHDLASLGLAVASRWAIVLCNVGAAELLRALPRIVPLVAEGGVLVGSGIWTQSAARVRREARALGLVMREERDEEGWHTMVWGRALRGA